MSETDMVERVARALFKVSIFQGYNDETLKAEWLRTRGIHMAQARAAIEAMREPTEAMTLAGDNNYEQTKDGWFGASPAVMWRAMIDAALQDKGQ